MLLLSTEMGGIGLLSGTYFPWNKYLHPWAQRNIYVFANSISFKKKKKKTASFDLLANLACDHAKPTDFQSYSCVFEKQKGSGSWCIYRGRCRQKNT